MLTRRQFAAATAATAAAIIARPYIVRAASPDAVTLQIDGAAVPYYAPIYVADAKGMFTSRNLAVNIIYAAASDIMRNVASGNVAFGFPNGDAVIAAKANGLPAKVVHTTYQRGIGALLALASSGIKSYADLKGKTVAVTSLGSANYVQLMIGLQKVNLSIDDVKLQVVATGAITQVLQAGQVDAIVFSLIRKYGLEADGTTKITALPSDDFLPSFGNVVVTGDSTLASSPGLVKRFLEALDEGINYIVSGHVDEALAISNQNYTPTWVDQTAVVKRTLEEVFIPTLWQSALTKQKGLGAADLTGWQTDIDSLAQYKIIDSSFKAADLVVQPYDIKG